MSDSLITSAAGFKKLVEKHRSEGWVNLDRDKQLFVCSYIKSGYSISNMTSIERGLDPEEAEAYLRDPLIRAAIADVGEQYAEITTFTSSGLQARLAKALDIAMGEIAAPMIDKFGREVMKRRVDLAAAAKLIQMAEKYAGIEGEDEVSEATPWSTEFPNGEDGNG